MRIYPIVVYIVDEIFQITIPSAFHHHCFPRNGFTFYFLRSTESVLYVYYFN